MCQHLSFMADTMDNTFSSLAHDLDETKATSGPYLDPTQNAAQMRNKLKTMCRQVYAVSARLTELSRTSNSLRGEMRGGLRESSCPVFTSLLPHSYLCPLRRKPSGFDFCNRSQAEDGSSQRTVGADDCFHRPDPRVEAAALQEGVCLVALL